MKGSLRVSRSFLEGEFQAPDGIRLSYFSSFASEGGNPLLLILHGFGEHSRRYLPLIEELKDLPFGFAACDLRGHGRSGGERVYADSFLQYAEDLEAFLDFLTGRYPGHSGEMLLFGHSMGAEIAALFALQNPARVRELILSSPCFGLFPGIPLGARVARLLGRRFPHTVLKNPVKPVFLSHDPVEVSEYESDPLVERRITLGLVREMIDAGETILARAGEILIPVRMLVAGNERIVDKHAAKEFYGKIASTDKRWIEFDGFYHDLFREMDRGRCVETLRNILKAFSV
ncbi:MAG TPA: lysophospholipase [Candidatus Omnitrophota bacterium]|nr:lysophospholipase [Candidatus Omnitrophota bacterium]